MENNKDKLFKKIENLRNNIDGIDEKIAELLNERALLARRIGQFKEKLDLPIFISEREYEILNNLRKNNSGIFSDDALERIFKLIIHETRKLEQEYSNNDEPND